MSDLLPIPALPPAPAEPARQPGWWTRLVHRRPARQARLLAAHHAWTTARARQAQLDLVRAGYHLGPVPYGYLPQPVTVPAPDGHARHRIRLVLDPGPAAIVAAAFRLRVTHRLTPSAIATALRTAQAHYSDIADPATGRPRPWTAASIGRVLTNPVYTGATVWGRTHNGQPVPPEHWAVCPHAHQPIIDGKTFYLAQLLATPASVVLSPHLPLWEFPADPPTDPGTDTDGSGPELLHGNWK